MKPVYFTLLLIFTFHRTNAQSLNTPVLTNANAHLLNYYSLYIEDIPQDEIAPDNYYYSIDNQSTSNATQAAVCCCSDTLNIGSFIINMGITPQTFGNGLMPYGMIYDLIINYKVPIIWSISPTKLKDGIDFSHNGNNYRGGTFIVPADFISPAVQGRITFWQSQGVVGAYTVSQLTPPVFDTLTSFPKVMIDNQGSNEGLLTPYYVNSGIPSSAYSIGSSSGLGNCFDIWTAPHSDPTWATHFYLYNFVTVRKGWIWAACHSISMMESCQNSVFPFNNLKFLTTTGLQCYNASSCNGIATVHAGIPTSPFSYYYPNDPPMQFMGIMDPACQNGSEKWFIPLSGGQWRATTKRGVTTSDGLSPREGAEISYGPAFANTANGYVMYEGGHSFTGSGTIPDQVAAQRAYLNYILWSGLKTRLGVSLTSATTMNAGTTYPVSAAVSTGIAPFTYNWTCNIGGSFSNPTSSSTNFTPPSVAADTTAVITVQVGDNCGRRNIKTICVRILSGSTLPVELLSFELKNDDDQVLLQWNTASETNNDFFGIERSHDAEYYEEIGRVDGAGNSSSINSYQFTDENPFLDISYYRLAQTDYDGAINYSNSLVFASTKSKNNSQQLFISPSPVINEIYFRFLGEEKNSAVITIYNSLGKELFQQDVDYEKGENVIKCNKNVNLISGLYLVNMRFSNGKNYSSRFVKK